MGKHLKNVGGWAKVFAAVGNGSEGNYWFDYAGADTNLDGISDTPYAIPDGSNEDRHPLMNP
jgi:nitrous oxidase accessory protein NosD